MIHARCDECSTERSISPYSEGPDGWLVVKEGNEDPLNFDTWACLSSYSTQQTINAEVGQ